ncbi:DUF692 domain-containing protein [Defluviimonas sp. WL0002]|uniref:UPF0276 protein OEW28_06120 n=1 Tax=Albidovulum marisflavi TaxID=2984159 RepID=A0ABT2ZBP4_9RHOB|nr:DUF692 domain-containing protein [Defluviimonas sp. WL0002]MCV2868201.1 DUF692 domain-containing protein [Defluviimonas sp. WL0002]
MLDQGSRRRLPTSPGIGYKPQHISNILEHPGPVEWLEIHAENYMGAGGRPIAQLRHLAERFPISVHGVGLSIGGEAPLDRDHLDRLKHLLNWLNPASFSEHLAWSTHGAEFLNDLLPLPYTNATLARVARHIDQVQECLGRQMLLENPSVYVELTGSALDEIDFLVELARRTGCGLLLDVNNVYVSSTNRRTDPQDYITRFPHDLVKEIHLGGHDEDRDDTDQPFLIDAHGSEVVDPVWQLYARTIELGGAKPTLIEWDNDVPDWPVLAAEAARAARILDRVKA